MPPFTHSHISTCTHSHTLFPFSPPGRENKSRSKEQKKRLVVFRQKSMAVIAATEGEREAGGGGEKRRVALNIQRQTCAWRNGCRRSRPAPASLQALPSRRSQRRWRMLRGRRQFKPRAEIFCQTDRMKVSPGSSFFSHPPPFFFFDGGEVATCGHVPRERPPVAGRQM